MLKQQFKHLSLRYLLKGWFDVPDNAEREISGLTLDTRQLERTQIFIALNGTQVDGNEFIDEAIHYGAAAILVEGESQSLQWRKDVPIICLPNLAQQYGHIAARFYGDPSQKMTVIGVTGTNGKTSISYFIAQSLQQLGHRCGIIGTLGCGELSQLQTSQCTTPDAISVQRHLATMQAAGVTYVAMEVSSHALAQYRVNGVKFNIGVFTNLSHEHLDYHGDMASYAAVKKRLFSDWQLDHAVVNADDDYGCQWLTEFWGNQRIAGYSADGINEKKLAVDGHIPLIYAKQVDLSANGIGALLFTPWGMGRLQSYHVGQFNVSNLLATLGVLCVLGERIDDVLMAFRQLTQVPGRMQSFAAEGAPLVVIDYAHTPDALEKVLTALRHHHYEKLYCVFGCGGARDKSKRPLMGAIAEQYADQVILTNDNPRTESPDTIVADIMTGIKQPDKAMIIMDREQAIRQTIEQARANDIVLIAGKGHEDYQETQGLRVHFSDVEQVEGALGKPLKTPT